VDGVPRGRNSGGTGRARKGRASCGRGPGRHASACGEDQDRGHGRLWSQIRRRQAPALTVHTIASSARERGDDLRLVRTPREWRRGAVEPPCRQR